MEAAVLLTPSAVVEQIKLSGKFDEICKQVLQTLSQQGLLDKLTQRTEEEVLKTKILDSVDGSKDVALTTRTTYAHILRSINQNVSFNKEWKEDVSTNLEGVLKTSPSEGSEEKSEIRSLIDKAIEASLSLLEQKEIQRRTTPTPTPVPSQPRSPPPPSPSPSKAPIAPAESESEDEETSDESGSSADDEDDSESEEDSASDSDGSGSSSSSSASESSSQSDDQRKTKERMVVSSLVMQKKGPTHLLPPTHLSRSQVASRGVVRTRSRVEFAPSDSESDGSVTSMSDDDSDQDTDPSPAPTRPPSQRIQARRQSASKHRKRLSRFAPKS